MNIKRDILTINFTPNGIKELRGVILHSMWGTHEGSITWFKNPESKASAHYLISKEGEITQMVEEKDMAWHAGYVDVPPCPEWLLPNPNYYTIGIELEDCRDVNWQYPEAQRQALRDLVADILARYKLPKERVVLHKETNPSRRSDPVGAFSREWLFNAPEITPKALEIIGIYKGLLGREPSKDELEWRVSQNQSGDLIIADILTDAIANASGGAWMKWFDPVIQAVKKGMEMMFNTTKADLQIYWQSQLESANNRIKVLESGLAENLDWKTLFSIAWKKWWLAKKGSGTA